MRPTLGTVTLAAMLGVFGAAAANAGVADGIVSGDLARARVAPVEKTQFFYNGQNYCWYDGGWRGPGWYWCGYAWNSGYGWGGGYGWNGWSNRGYRNRGYGHRAPAGGGVVGGHAGQQFRGARTGGGSHMGGGAHVGGGAHMGGGGAHMGGGGGGHMGGGGGGHMGGGGGGGARQH